MSLLSHFRDLAPALAAASLVPAFALALAPDVSGICGSVFVTSRGV